MPAVPAATHGAGRRRAWIADTVARRGVVTIAALAQELAVSEMTIRRDARELENLDAVVRMHGALRRPEGQTDSTLTFIGRHAQHPEEKLAIGRAAADLIGNNDSIIIDAGSTPLAVAKALPSSFAGTVITHSIPVILIAEALPRTRTIVLGGELYRSSRALVGDSAVTAARDLRATTLFLGSAAADTRGAYSTRDVERTLKRVMLSIVDRVVLTVDDSKFDSSAPVHICGWDAIDVVVTSAQPPEDVMEVMRAHDCELVVAS